VAHEDDEIEREPCPHCGRRILVTATICRFCGGNPDMPLAGDSLGGMIPYRNPSALWAYYLGIFSLLPCFPLGIVAVVLGFKGLKLANERPLAHGRVHAWIGIVLGGLCGLLWLILTVVALLGGFSDVFRGT
jgi:hypothetical protein